MFNTFINDLGTDMSMLIWFAEDAKWRGLVNVAWDALQEEVCDLDYSNRNEMKFSTTKWKVFPWGLTVRTQAIGWELTLQWDTGF